LITSIVYWTGPNCIPVRYSTGLSTDIGMACDGYSERTYFAVDGQYVGADPMPFDTTVTLGCSLLINGVPDNTDYAPAGDRHNVDCCGCWLTTIHRTRRHRRRDTSRHRC
jgi:hypothetical protein